MNLLEEYVKMFGDKPPKLIMTSYEDEVYQNLLDIAISNKQRITTDVVEEAYKDFKIDLITKNQFSNFKKPIN